jgi:hypothetical protein
MNLYSQVQPINISYFYDNAGNRIQRKLYSTQRIGTPDSSYTNPVKEKLDLSMTVYPNPTQDKLEVKIIKGDIDENIGQLFMYDISGKEIENKQLQLTSFTLQLEHLQKGTYFLKIIVKEEEFEWKIIKQ